MLHSWVHPCQFHFGGLVHLCSPPQICHLNLLCTDICGHPVFQTVVDHGPGWVVWKATLIFQIYGETKPVNHHIIYHSERSSSPVPRVSLSHTLTHTDHCLCWQFEPPSGPQCSWTRFSHGCHGCLYRSFTQLGIAVILADIKLRRREAFTSYDTSVTKCVCCYWSRSFTM